jgi:MraZ protein
MESKGRLSIPSGFRLELQRRSERAPILTNADEYLVLYPYEDWCEHEQRIVERSSFDPDAQAYARMMISGASECPIDAQGRILVPPVLREYARLEREASRRRRAGIELWDKAAFRREPAEDAGAVPEISSARARLGRQQA